MVGSYDGAKDVVETNIALGLNLSDYQNFSLDSRGYNNDERTFWPTAAVRQNGCIIIRFYSRHNVPKKSDKCSWWLVESSALKVPGKFDDRIDHVTVIIIINHCR